MLGRGVEWGGCCISSQSRSAKPRLGPGAAARLSGAVVEFAAVDAGAVEEVGPDPHAGAYYEKVIRRKPATRRGTGNRRRSAVSGSAHLTAPRGSSTSHVHHLWSQLAHLRCLSLDSIVSCLVASTRLVDASQIGQFIGDPARRRWLGFRCGCVGTQSPWAGSCVPRLHH